MRFKPFVTAFSLLSGLAFLCGVSRADSTVTLAVQGEYSDQTTFSGTLIYDQTAQAFIGGNITDSAGLNIFNMSFDAQTYTGQNAYTIMLPSGCVSNCHQFGAEFYTSANPYGLPYLDLYFAGDPSTFAGGAIEATQTYVGYFGETTNTSQESINEGVVREVISGSLSVPSAAPEPASWMLFAPGLGLLALAIRWTRHQSAK